MPKKSENIVGPTKRTFLSSHLFSLLIAGTLIVLLAIIGVGGYFWHKSALSLVATQHQVQLEMAKLKDYATQLANIQQELSSTQTELQQIQSTDQFQKNQELQTEITAIHDQFSQSVVEYEDLLRLKDLGVKTQPMDAMFANTLVLLSQRNYASASAQLKKLSLAIQQQQAALATAGATPLTAVQSNDLPTNGYRRQSVQSDSGTFVVDLIAGDLNTARVQVETASPGDCGNNCPVDSLANFVAHSGGFAGVNGPYFCPAEYPSCAGKTNSFDTLLMNKNKVYFNSANNVYSIVPVAVFSGNSVRFIEHSEDWGRDTGVDAVIAGQPLLLLNGDIKFGGDGDPKKTSLTTRAFIANKNQTVYIGAVHSASVVDVAHVLKALGLQNAINLDDGGSIALSFNGHYIDGPGRNTPFGIVLVRK